MVVCTCTRWMHTAGIEEPLASDGPAQWLIRLECCGCGRRIAAVATPQEGRELVDRLMWTDAALARLERMPPYLQTLITEEAEKFARARGARVISFGLLHQARQGGDVRWDEDAERRLERVPAPVRALARVELERTALERGDSRVTVALMEDVKARYFGMFAPTS